MARRYIPPWDAPMQRFFTPVQADTVRDLQESYRVPIVERFFAHSDSISPAADGRNMTMQLRNPAGSGVRLIWEAVILWCNATRMYRLALVSNASNLATIASGQTNFRSVGRAPLGVPSFNNNNIFTQFVATERIEANTPTTIPLGAEIRETFAYQFILGNTSEALAADVWNIEWVWSELP